MAKPTPSDTSTRTARRTTTSSRPLAGGKRRAALLASNVKWDIPLTSANIFILLAGIAVIILGYFLMSTGIADDPLKNQGVWNNAAAVTVAPILLGLGYCVIIPIALLYRKKSNDVDVVEKSDIA